MTRILHSKATTDRRLPIGDLVEVIVRKAKKKKEMLSSPHVVLELDVSAWNVTVPCSAGRTIAAALEDIEPAIEPE